MLVEQAGGALVSFGTVCRAFGAHIWQSGTVRRRPTIRSRISLQSNFGGSSSMSTATKPAKKKAPAANVKLQPLGERIVLEREESETMTSGGIVLPDTAKNKPARGTVIAVGEGRLLDDGSRGKLQVKV